MSFKTCFVRSLALLTISFLLSMSCSRENENTVQKTMSKALRSKDDALLKSSTFRMIEINPNNFHIFSHNRPLIDKDESYRIELLRRLIDASRDEENNKYGVMLNIANVYGRIAVKSSELTGIFDATSEKDLIKEHFLNARRYYEEANILAKTSDAEYAEYTVLNMYGEFLIQTGMFDDAEDVYRKCLQVGYKPGLANSFWGIGRSLYFNQKYDEARDYFKRAIEADVYSWAPKSYVTSSSYTFLGFIACNQDKLDESVWYLQESGKAKKSAFNAVYDLNLCKKLIDKGRAQDVKEFLEKLLLEFRPNNNKDIEDLLDSLQESTTD